MRRRLIIVAVLFLSSGALAESRATDTAQNECVVKVYKEYLAASLARYQQEGAATSIDDVTARRRLMEGYCVQFVRCINVPPLAQGAIFSKCLDDEDADRLNDGK